MSQMFPVAFCPVLLGRDCVRHQVGWWGWGGGGCRSHPSSYVCCRCRAAAYIACAYAISGAALDDAEHSLADLDFRDQLARRLFCVRYVQRPFLSRSRPVADLVIISHSLLPPRSRRLALLLLGCSLFVCVSTARRVLCAFFAFGRRVEKFLANVSRRVCINYNFGD